MTEKWIDWANKNNYAFHDKSGKVKQFDTVVCLRDYTWITDCNFGGANERTYSKVKKQIEAIMKGEGCDMTSVYSHEYRFVHVSKRGLMCAMFGVAFGFLLSVINLLVMVACEIVPKHIYAPASLVVLYFIMWMVLGAIIAYKKGSKEDDD